MPSPATSRPNLRTARIVDGRSWIVDAQGGAKRVRPSRMKCRCTEQSSTHRPHILIDDHPSSLRYAATSASPLLGLSPRAHADGTKTNRQSPPLPLLTAHCSLLTRHSILPLHHRHHRRSSPFQLLRFSAFQHLPQSPPRVPTPRQSRLHRLSVAPHCPAPHAPQSEAGIQETAASSKILFTPGFDMPHVRLELTPETSTWEAN